MKWKTAMKQLTSINRCFENFMNQINKNKGLVRKVFNKKVPLCIW